ncbi:MAG: HpcH/HpaI aldolase/citrate lyase family protein [Burkholderiales bacterium]|jgi:citrate lyase beta subunit
MSLALNPRRCLLFVPGSRPERFEKALATDADQVCIDLEDAVPLADKATARQATLDFIAAAGSLRSELGLRINNATSALGRADLVAISSGGFRPAFVMLPKVESADEILRVLEILNHAEIPLIAQLESPHAVFEARAIANATKQLQALMFGGFDYAVAARIKPGYDGWLWARGMIAAAAAEAETGAIDVPSLEIKDVPEVALDTQRVMDLGFTSKSAIHPAQVDVIQRAFLPTSHELAHAEKVVAAMKAANGGAIAVDGKLVDRPIELAAIRVMDLAKLGLRDTDTRLANVA